MPSVPERDDCEKLARDKEITVFALSSAIVPQEFMCQVAELATA